MKPHVTLFLALFCYPLLAGEFHLQLKTRTVYIVPMANALDGHLASRMTSSRVLWVVLEPGNADAVLTDRVDDAFWSWASAHYNRAAKTSGTGLNNGVAAGPEHRGKRGDRGTVFLVDPRNAMVLWSTYEPMPDSSPDALDRAAEHIAGNLKKSLNVK